MLEWIVMFSDFIKKFGRAPAWGGGGVGLERMSWNMEYFNFFFFNFFYQGYELNIMVYMRPYLGERLISSWLDMRECIYMNEIRGVYSFFRSLSSCAGLETL